MRKGRARGHWFASRQGKQRPSWPEFTAPENKAMPTGPALPLQLKKDLILGMESLALGTDLPGGLYRFVRCLPVHEKVLPREVTCEYKRKNLDQSLKRGEGPEGLSS